MRYALYTIACFLFLTSCKKEIKIVPDDGPLPPPASPPSGAYVPDQGFKIIAYYFGVNNPDSIEQRKYKMITHLNFAFLYPNADGSLKALDREARFKTVLQRAKENGVKTAVSLAGSETIYSSLSANPGYRTRLVKNVLQFAIDNELDGIDIDWEYPRANKANDITFELLMKEFSDSLHRWHKYLSAAITPALYAGAVRDGISKEAMAYTDFFNIMIYDGLNWDSNNPAQHSTYRMAETSLDIWVDNKGMPKTKAIVGIPAYGKDASNQALSYRTLLNRGANPHLESFTTGGTTYYYNSIDIVKQKALLAKNRANGVMLWEFFQDANGDNSLCKAVNDALGRPY